MEKRLLGKVPINYRPVLKRGNSTLKTEDLRGYLTYQKGKKVYCIFYDGATPANVLASFQFSTSFDAKEDKAFLKKRPSNKQEQVLIQLRTRTVDLLQKEGFVTVYPNTSFNIVPIVEKGNNRVYVLTGTTVEGVVLFGNDYLLTFDDNLELTSKKAIHKSLLPVGFEEQEGGNSVHVHDKGADKFISPTDICTLLLMGKYSGWKQHTVISASHISIWNCKKEDLFILPKNNLENILYNKPREQPTDDANASRHRAWLKKHQIAINQLPKANPQEVIYTCDSTLLLRRINGDTMLLWTVSSTMSLGLETMGEKFVENRILNNPRFGKTAYVNGIDFQGNIGYITLAPYTFLIRNDSLMQLETFCTVSEDSVAALYDQWYAAKGKKKQAALQQIEAVSYEAFKLIFHPQVFENNVYKGNLKGDEVEIVNRWEKDGQRYYRIAIKNQRGDSKTRYTFVIDQAYKLVEYEGCNQEALEAMTKAYEVELD